MSQKFNPNQLKKARLARGITMTDLSKKTEISRQSISKYEMGISEPRGKNLVAIVNALNFPLQYFRKESTPQIKGTAFFRSQSASTNKLRNMQEVRIEYVDEIKKIFSEYINFPKLNLPEKLNKELYEITNDDIKNQAKALRELWQLGDGPIENLISTLEINGIFVSESAMKSDKLDAVSQWIDGTPFIVLTDNEESSVRRRYNVAHELGHIVLHDSIESIFEIPAKDYKKVLENQANLFAAHFLMPDEAFIESLLSTSLDFFIELKKYWKVSIQAAIYNTYHNLELMTEDQFLYLNKKISWNKWRRKEPLDDIIPIEKPEMLAKAYDMLVHNKIFSQSELIQRLSLPADELAKILSIQFQQEPKTPSLKLVESNKDNHLA